MKGESEWERGTGRPKWLAGFALVCVIAVLAIRMTSPSDIHDQTQPKTVAYTTNIVLHADRWSRWVLPLENEEYPATKPLLYNWLAVPFVAVTQGWYEWAHKVPSIASFLLIVVIVFRVARRTDPDDGTTAWWAVVIFSTNYMWFKLAYLARPDTLLSLFLITGWVAATMLAVGSGSVSGSNERARGSGCWRLVLWGSAGMALLVKGSAAILVPLFVVVLFWFVDDDGEDAECDRRNRFRERMRLRFLWRRTSRALRDSGAWWGVVVAILPFAMWMYLAWGVNPDHVYDVLIREEVTDRLLGIGSEGTKYGPWDFLVTLPAMPWAFVSRFFPWSILFCGSLIDLFGRPARGRVRGLARDGAAGGTGRARVSSEIRVWLISCLVGTFVPIVVFTFSAGKRGDYVASSFIPASILTAWWLNHLGFRLGKRMLSLVGLGALITLVGLGVFAFRFNLPVEYPLGNALWKFAGEARPIVESGAGTSGEGKAMAVEFYQTGRNPLQTVLFRSQLDDPEATARRVERREAFWLFVQARDVEALRREAWVTAVGGWRFEEVARSDRTMSDPTAKPLEVVLFRATPK